MSNAEVGKVYQAIIDEVINESRIFFEDNGIDELTLQELKRLWEEKLSNSKVADFPWDEVQPKSEYSQLSDRSLVPDLPAVGTVDPVMVTTSVKTEPGTQPTLNGLYLPTGPNPAASGNSGGNSSTNSGQNSSSVLYLPTYNNAGGSSDGASNLEGNPRLLQTDGAADGVDMSKEEKVDEYGIPLSLGLDDENDSDVINSDLDDSDDDVLDSAKMIDEFEGMMILCLFEKVQRVKTKWKCVLKDGIANINGKDYVFVKGTGDTEW